MLDVKGKSALVTGGSLGIGRSTVEIFTGEGIETTFTFHRHADEAADLVRRTGANSIRADLATEEGCRTVLHILKDTNGYPDILVHNAGIWTHGPMGELSYETWRQTMALNLDAVALLTNGCVPAMAARGGGTIILVSSTAARRGEAFHAHYAASKGALISLARSLAAELGPRGIRTNVVAPGWVDTPMSREELSRPGRRDDIIRTIPLRRIPPPEDIAYPILFLASNWARHVNGAVLDINGGAVLIGG